MGQARRTDRRDVSRNVVPAFPPMTDGGSTSLTPERSITDGPLAPELVKLAEAIGRALAREHYAAEQRRLTRQKLPEVR